MKKLLLLVLLPLFAQADPHFGPAFERDLLLAVSLCLFVFPLLIAQVVGWALAKIKGKKNNIWVIRTAAIFASWFGVYCIFNKILSLHGDGLVSAKGSIYLAVFAFVGACLGAPLATK